MSHHLDSPIARQDIRLDITDLYLFRGEIGTVFIINVCHSIAGEISIPGYHPEGMYEFKVDLNRDAIEDLTYRLTFDPRDTMGNQRYVLRRIAGASATDPSAAGTVSRDHRRKGDDLQWPSHLGGPRRRSSLCRRSRLMPEDGAPSTG